MKQSVDVLKIIAKLFAVKTQKENFFVNSIEKIKQKVEDYKNSADEFVDYEKQLKMHFWNIHQVYLNTLKSLQEKLDSLQGVVQHSCTGFQEFNGKIIFEGCSNKQKIEYIRDLFQKFARLADHENLHSEVLTAIMDVFGLSKAMQ